MRTMIVAISAVLIFSVAVAGESTMAEPIWSVSQDGSLRFSPPPSWNKNELKIMLALPPNIDLADIVWPEDPKSRSVRVENKRIFGMDYFDGLQTMLPCLLHGGLDMASLSDAETHFKKLKLGSSDEELLARIGSASPRGLAPTLTVRWSLDRLLAVRLCGARKIKKALAPLQSIAGSKDEDTFVRDAASASIALIQDQPVQQQGKSLPPLQKSLAYLPQDYDLLILFRSCNAPYLRLPCRAIKQISDTEMKRLTEHSADQAGIKVWESMIQDFTVHDDVKFEINYELARAFGNARWDRGIIAIKDIAGQTSGPAAVMLEGSFPADRYRERLAKLKPETSDDLTVYRKPDAQAQFAFSTSELLYGKGLVLGSNKSSPSLASQWDYLQKMGIDGPESLWIHLRDTAPIVAGARPVGPFAFVRDLKSATVGLSADEKGTALKISLIFDSAENAKSAADGMKALQPMVAGQVEQILGKKNADADAIIAISQSAAIEVKGTALTVGLKAPDRTPQALLEMLAAILTAGN